MLKRCEICGREFIAQRSTAKCCSSTCRSRKRRGLSGESSAPVFAGELKPPATARVMSEDEVHAVIQQAHGTAADLSRASLQTPAPLCLSLKAVAVKLESALRGEGL